MDSKLVSERIKQWFEEDIGPGDVTTEATIDKDVQASAKFLCKAQGVVCGISVVDQVFEEVSSGQLQCIWKVKDGDILDKGSVFGSVQGPAHMILKGERIALNIMQRMSGIATACHEMEKAAKAGALLADRENHKCRILDTRKTVPGLRMFDKYAVSCGGATNHRFGLYDMIMIKDNHISAAGGIGQAVEKVWQYKQQSCRKELMVEVETSTLDEVREALRYSDKIDRIMLDNMTYFKEDGSLDISMLKEAVILIDGAVQTEASGNITLETVSSVASLGVDFISSGALTHSVDALDISLKIHLQS